MTSAGQSVAAFLRLRSASTTYTNEDDLQASLAAQLHPLGDREVCLSDGRSRIDLLVGRIGIEVKVAGSLASVIRQLDRYAACVEIDELILVTTRAKHARVPQRVGRRLIPVHLVSLIENGL